eukprot:132575-Rhodomonas_salina.2
MMFWTLESVSMYPASAHHVRILSPVHQTQQPADSALHRALHGKTDRREPGGRMKGHRETENRGGVRGHSGGSEGVEKERVEGARGDCRTLAVLLAVQELLLFGGIHHLNFQPPRRLNSACTHISL